jgi:hypothetical protein
MERATIPGQSRAAARIGTLVVVRHDIVERKPVVAGHEVHTLLDVTARARRGSAAITGGNCFGSLFAQFALFADS